MTKDLPMQCNNLGQNIVGKFTKLSKFGVTMECLTADFSHFFSTAVKVCPLASRLATRHQFQSFQRLS